MGTVYGTSGDNTLDGTASDDVIEAGAGSDTIRSGAGNDRISDIGGRLNFIDAGDGNDRIDFRDDYGGGRNTPFGTILTTIAIRAGTGSDTVSFSAARTGSAAIDLGSGDDVLWLGQALEQGPVIVTLGTGRDRVILTDEFQISRAISITDFAAGHAGDVLDLSRFLAVSGPNWLGFAGIDTNYFADGRLLLRQDGADTLVLLDDNGPAPDTVFTQPRVVLRLVGVDAGLLTATNFAGLDPAGTPLVQTVQTGTAGADVLFASVSGQLSGAGGNDRLEGAAGDDVLLGGTGNDALSGSFGNDRLEGGAGDDALDGGSGSDTLLGGDGNDTLSDTASGNDMLDGGAGDDTILVVRPPQRYADVRRSDVVAILGGSGNDHVTYSNPGSSDVAQLGVNVTLTVDLGDGDDDLTLNLLRTSATITLGAGRDTVILSPNYLTPHATAVITDFVSGKGGDRLDLTDALGKQYMGFIGGDAFATGELRLIQQGADTLVAFDYDGEGASDETQPIVILRGVAAQSLTAENFAGIDPLLGPARAQTITGTAVADYLIGTAGADTVRAGMGADRVLGRAGNDLISGESGNDTLDGGRGSDRLDGGSGDDTLIVLGDGSDTVIGGIGNDTIDFQAFYPGGGSTFGAAVLQAGDGDDLITFAAEYLSLKADLGAGNDRITFTGLPLLGTTLTLGSGTDVVTLDLALASQQRATVIITDFQTGTGGDVFDVTELFRAMIGSGVDKMRWIAGDVDELYNAFVGAARFEQRGADTALILNTWANDEVIALFQNTRASQFTAYNVGGLPLHPVTAALGDTADDWTGTAGEDVVHANGGDDVLRGLGGNDILRGGSGSDRLEGGDGDDLLLGGGGSRDLLYGGAGNDRLGGGTHLDGGDGNDLISTGIAIKAYGGAGDDRIVVAGGGLADAFIGKTGIVNAGSGNDYVELEDAANAWDTGATTLVDLGAGDDVIVAGDLRGTVTLGTGRDTIRPFGYQSQQLVITDFQTGEGGDRVDFGTIGSEEFANPFLGLFELVQDGADTVLIGRGSFETRLSLRFLNTTAADFTDANFTASQFPRLDPHPATFQTRIISATTELAASQTITAQDPRPVRGTGTAYLYASEDGSAVFTNHARIEVTAPSALYGRSTAAILQGEIGFFSAGAGRIVNAADGTLIVSARGDVTGYAGRSGGIDFTNAGLIDVSGQQLDAPSDTTRIIGISIADGTDTLIANSGTIRASGGGTNIGIRVDSALSVSNSGTIEATAAAGQNAIGYEGRNGTSTLRNTGEIRAFGADSAIGVYFNNAGANPLFNDGIIAASVLPGSFFAGVGVLVDDPGFNPAAPSVFTNSGTIIGDIAMVFRGTTADTTAEVLINTGTIKGAVLSNGGDDLIRNSGTMDGRTMLGYGNDTYDGTGGQHRSTVEGGIGNDALTGGGRTDFLFGDGGADLLIGGAGDDFLDGGLGSDVLDGGLGFDTASWLDSAAPVSVDLALGSATTVASVDWLGSVEQVIGSRGNDGIAGSAANEALIGFAGNDTLDGRAGADVLWGGRGRDTMTGGAGADTFVFTIGDGADTISDFTAGDLVQIHGYTGYKALVQEAGGLRVVLSKADSVLLMGVTDRALAQAGLRFETGPTRFTLPEASRQSLVSDSDVVIGSGIAVRIADPDPVLRGFYPPIYSIAIHLSGPRDAIGIGLHLDGTVNFSTALEPEMTIGVSTVGDGYSENINSAVIGKTGKLVVTALHGKAVGLASITQNVNHGTISVTARDGDASGVMGIFLARPNDPDMPNFLVNHGTIAVKATGVARGVDQGENSNGALYEINHGKIVVHGAGGSVGIQNYMAAHPAVSQPVMINTGTITVTDTTTALDSAGLQINLSSRAKVWNTGTITADFAVQVIRGSSFSAAIEYNLGLFNGGTLAGEVVLSSYDDTLVNSGRITGNVDLGGGNDVYDGRAGQLGGRLSGYDGDDILLAGAGDQLIDGGFGNDVLSGGAGADTLIGGAGQDVFRFGKGFGADVIADLKLGVGRETIAISGYTAAQSIAQQGADVLITFSATDSLLVRHATVAAITAGVLQFGAAAIRSYSIGAMPDDPAAPGGPELPADAGITFKPVFGTLGADTLTGRSGPDRIDGRGGDDTIAGGTGGDQLLGGDGADRLSGDGGNDTLIGGLGRDRLSGGSGSDILVGGRDADALTGGGGADVFRYAALAESTATARDVITDFRQGDRIDLSAIDAVPGYIDDPFRFMDAAPAAGEGLGVVWFDRANRLLYASTDADAAAEFVVKIGGTAIIGADDLVL